MESAVSGFCCLDYQFEICGLDSIPSIAMLLPQFFVVGGRLEQHARYSRSSPSPTRSRARPLSFSSSLTGGTAVEIFRLWRAAVQRLPHSQFFDACFRSSAPRDGSVFRVPGSSVGHAKPLHILRESIFRANFAIRRGPTWDAVRRRRVLSTGTGCEDLSRCSEESSPRPGRLAADGDAPRRYSQAVIGWRGALPGLVIYRPDDEPPRRRILAVSSATCR